MVHYGVYIEYFTCVVLLNKYKVVNRQVAGLVAFSFSATEVLSADKYISRFPSNLNSSKLTCYVNSVLVELRCRMIRYLTAERRVLCVQGISYVQIDSQNPYRVYFKIFKLAYSTIIQTGCTKASEKTLNHRIRVKQQSAKKTEQL